MLSKEGPLKKPCLKKHQSDKAFWHSVNLSFRISEEFFRPPVAFKQLSNISARGNLSSSFACIFFQYRPHKKEYIESSIISALLYSS